MGYEAEQQNRINRALYQPLKIVKLDKAKQTAIIESSKHNDFYTVTPNSCTCPDFQKRGVPCKHIYKLRSVLFSDSETETTKKKEKTPKTTTFLYDVPTSVSIVIGVIFLVVAFFLSGASVFAAIVVAFLGAYFIYDYVAFKRHPDNPKFITNEQLIRWQQLVHSEKQTVQELKKVSLPVLLDLKAQVSNYYLRLCVASTSSDIEKWSELLLNTQSKIVDLSEFIILNGDEPKMDLERYWDFLNDFRN